jgi:hypothetical protein
MAGIPKTTVNQKKVWTAPKLKKTSIETITAAGGSGHPDGTGGSKS